MLLKIKLYFLNSNFYLKAKTVTETLSLSFYYILFNVLCEIFIFRLSLLEKNIQILIDCEL